MQNNVALFVPYFGKLPSYFPFFIKSLEAQPVTVFIITDSDYADGLPENCKWIKTTLQETISLIEKKLNIKTNIKSGYKLCDFKPMYGEIFSDYLIDFDFWGHIDPDTIMGNFGTFITDELLNRIDFYSGRKGYVSGPMFLVRNKYEINQLWRKSKNIDIVCKSSNCLGFDECGGRHWDDLDAGKSIFDCNTAIQSFTELIKLEEKQGLRTCFKSTTLEPKGLEPVVFTNNSLFYGGTEYMLLHLIYFKTKFYFNIPNKYISYSYINSYGFFYYNPNSFRFFLLDRPFIWFTKKIYNQF